MKVFYEKHRKMLALLLVAAMVFSVVRPGMLQKVAASGDEATVTDAAPAEEVAETNTADVTNDEVTDVADNDESVADSVSDDTEVDDADEADEDEEEDDPTIMAAKTLHVRVEESKCDITINAPEGSLPYAEDKLSVSVREIKEGTEDYDFYMTGIVNALGQDSADIISFARLFDIKILCDGEEVEPDSPVEVKIEYDEAPEISEDSEMSIVHFADTGVEVIDDIDINADGTEIVYEQESFSVTATIVSGDPAEPTERIDSNNPDKGTYADYVVVAESGGTYYTVQNDGSLKAIDPSKVNITDPDNITITEDASFVWKYAFIDGKYYLRYAAEGYAFGDNKVASEFKYTFIAPNEDSGLVSATPKHDEKTKQVERDGDGNLIYEDVKPDHSPIVFSGNTIKSGDKYLSITDDKKSIKGNVTTDPSPNVKFYLAKTSMPYSDMPNHHTVNHIDISIEDDVENIINLAYGTYYDKTGNPVLVIDKEHYPNGKQIPIKQKFDVSQECLRNATIKAYKKNPDGTAGEEVDNAFYITGYTANDETNLSTPQVRIEGVFKVSYGMDDQYGNGSPYADITDTSDPKYQNPDSDQMKLLKNRLDHTILYKVEAQEKDAKFYYINPDYQEDPNNPDDPNRFLYDAKGNILYTTADIDISASFDYFDSGNQCPALYDYNPTIWGTNDTENMKGTWQKGRIHPWGISGMDFDISGGISYRIRPYAVDIHTSILDADGNPIIPASDIQIKHNVYVDQNGDPDSVIGKNVGGYDGFEADTSSYPKKAERTVTISKDPDKKGTDTVYVYDNEPLPQGMVCIDEDKSTVPDKIVDKDGNTWEYSKTVIETEYVRRDNDSNYDKTHFSDDYTKSDPTFRSVPEVIGTHGNRFNEFLDFYVRNIYDKVVPPHKKEVAPYEGTGALGGVNAGDEITYEISYTNYKSIDSNVYIRDVLDDNVEFVSASDNGQFAVDRVEWTINDVPAGKEGKVTLTVKVKDSAETKNGGPGYVKNGGDTAKVSVGNGKWYTLEEVENPVPKTSEKREISPFEGTGTLGEVAVKGLVVYEITYKNYKDAPADIVITDKLDPNVEFVEASDGGKNEDGTVKWTLSNVPAGKEGSVTLTVKVLRSALESKGGPGEIVNGGKTSTVKVGNDKAYSLDLVKNPVVDTPETPVAPHKREVSPYVGNGKLGEVKVGEKIVYEISYTNYKNDPADIVIVDKLDANVEFVEASDDGVYDKDAGTVTWTIKDVPAEKEGKVTLTVKVLESTLVAKNGPGKVVNGGETATVQVGNDAIFTLEEVENPVITSSTKSKTDKTTTAVKTGDSTPIIPIIIVMAVALAGIISVIVIRRKKAKNEPEKNK